MRVVGGVASGYQPHPRGGERPIRLDGLAGPSAPVPQHVGESYRAGQMRSAPDGFGEDGAEVVAINVGVSHGKPVYNLASYSHQDPRRDIPQRVRASTPTASAAQSRRVQQ